MRLFSSRTIERPRECPMCVVYRTQYEALREQRDRDLAALRHAREIINDLKSRCPAQWDGPVVSATDAEIEPPMAVTDGEAVA